MCPVIILKISVMNFFFFLSFHTEEWNYDIHIWICNISRVIFELLQFEWKLFSLFILFAFNKKKLFIYLCARLLYQYKFYHNYPTNLSRVVFTVEFLLFFAIHILRMNYYITVVSIEIITDRKKKLRYGYEDWSITYSFNKLFAYINKYILLSV